jgi:hypothetical protein
MHDRNWKLEYQRLLDRLSGGQAAPPTLAGRERRCNPRLTLSSQQVLLQSDPVPVLPEDTRDGFLFESLHPLPVGTQFPVRLGEEGAFTARVEECCMVETDGAFLEYRYRMRCSIHASRGSAAPDQPRPSLDPVRIDQSRH